MIQIPKTILDKFGLTQKPQQIKVGLKKPKEQDKYWCYDRYCRKLTDKDHAYCQKCRAKDKTKANIPRN